MLYLVELVSLLRKMGQQRVGLAGVGVGRCYSGRGNRKYVDQRVAGRDRVAAGPATEETPKQRMCRCCYAARAIFAT